MTSGTTNSVARMHQSKSCDDVKQISRKLSTKESKSKLKHKDAERVEKLRSLVNYLKSGSSQPIVSPVTLEADEIELAERYKSHMSLREDLLKVHQINGLLPSPSSQQDQKDLNSSCSSSITDAVVVSTPKVMTRGVNSASHSSISAWSHPQHLATWIDNEVNSLVHDLEAGCLPT